jgi:hypothetical protein
MKTDTKWYKTMLEKHGSDEAITEFMRSNQKKSRENYSGKGGFYARRDLAVLGGKKSKRGSKNESKVSES